MSFDDITGRNYTSEGLMGYRHDQESKKYHPDKVNDLGEDVKKSATEKFRSVNEAYESLKKQRGIA